MLRQITNILLAIMLVLIKSHQDIFKGCSKLDNLKKISIFQEYKTQSDRSRKLCIEAEIDSIIYEPLTTEERRNSSGTNLILRQSALYQEFRTQSSIQSQETSIFDNTLGTESDTIESRASKAEIITSLNSESLSRKYNE